MENELLQSKLKFYYQKLALSMKIIFSNTK